MTEKQRLIFELLGMFVCLSWENKKKYINILKVMFPKEFEELEWQK